MGMRQACLKEQAKRVPLIKICGLKGATVAQVGGLLRRLVGDDLLDIYPKGNNVMVKVRSRHAVGVLMNKNGEALVSGEVLRISQSEFHFTHEELLDWVENELRCQEKADNLGRTGLWEKTGAHAYEMKV